jgi:hypothetical protein
VQTLRAIRAPPQMRFRRALRDSVNCVEQRLFT